MAKAKILLAEDDASLIKMYEKKFNAAGFEVILAYDGEDGLKKALAEKPDLIVTDVLMPKIDGISLFHQLRAKPETFKIPVLFLSSFYDQDAIFDCFKLGAVDYLIKSEFTLDEIVQKVENLLAGKEGPVQPK